MTQAPYSPPPAPAASSTGNTLGVLLMVASCVFMAYNGWEALRPAPVPVPSPDDVSKWWREFDAEPHLGNAPIAERYKVIDQRLLAHPTPDATLASRERNGEELRYRMAMVLSPETRAIGYQKRTLYPSADPMKCAVWAVVWKNDNADSLRAFGFKSIVCGKDTWPLLPPGPGAHERRAHLEHPARHLAGQEHVPVNLDDFLWVGVAQ